MLLRAIGGSDGLYPELSTAATRWRPRALCCCVARRGEDTARGKSGGGSQTRRVGLPSKQEVAGLALHGGGRHCTAAAARGAEQTGRLEVEERTSFQFPKIPGTQL